MDKRIQIWNLLHDGEITAISADGNNLTMFVNIPYLRRRLSPLGDSFVLSLKGLRQLEFRDFGGKTGHLRDELDIGSPEILETSSESMPVAIETTMGRLTIDFENISFALDTGQDVDYETIERVCGEYWTEWKARTQQPSA